MKISFGNHSKNLCRGIAMWIYVQESLDAFGEFSVQESLEKCVYRNCHVNLCTGIVTWICVQESLCELLYRNRHMNLCTEIIWIFVHGIRGARNDPSTSSCAVSLNLIKYPFCHLFVSQFHQNGIPAVMSKRLHLTVTCTVLRLSVGNHYIWEFKSYKSMLGKNVYIITAL